MRREVLLGPLVPGRGVRKAKGRGRGREFSKGRAGPS